MRAHHAHVHRIFMMDLAHPGVNYLDASVLYCKITVNWLIYIFFIWILTAHIRGNIYRFSQVHAGTNRRTQSHSLAAHSAAFTVPINLTPIMTFHSTVLNNSLCSPNFKFVRIIAFVQTRWKRFQFTFKTRAKEFSIHTLIFKLKVHSFPWKRVKIIIIFHTFPRLFEWL